MSDLMPCPFCGSKAELQEGTQRQHWVECCNHKCRSMGANCEGPLGAAEAWNTRQPAPSGNGWLPIETAPKDGTRLWAWWKKFDIGTMTDTHHQGFIYWNANEAYPEDGPYWSQDVVADTRHWPYQCQSDFLVEPEGWFMPPATPLPAAPAPGEAAESVPAIVEGYWCQPCRDTGAMHCSDPENCGQMKLDGKPIHGKPAATGKEGKP